MVVVFWAFLLRNFLVLRARLRNDFGGKFLVFGVCAWFVLFGAVLLSCSAIGSAFPPKIAAKIFFLLGLCFLFAEGRFGRQFSGAELLSWGHVIV